MADGEGQGYRRSVMPVARGGKVVWLLAIEWPRFVTIATLARCVGVSEHYMQQRFIVKLEGIDGVPVEWSEDGKAVRLMMPKGEG